MLAPLVLAAAACRDNPGFVLDSAGNDRDGTTAETTAETTAASDETTADAPRCEPTQTTVQTDVCEWAALNPDAPNLVENTTLLLADETCGVNTDFYIERHGTKFYRCEEERCGGDCDPERAVDISNLPPLYANQFPGEDGACVRLWHHSEMHVDGCESTAYALFDADDRGRLRFAAAKATKHADINPFGDAVDVDISALEKAANCDDESVSDLNCPSEGSGYKIDFRFGACEIDDALQGSEWSDLVVDDVTYKLNLYSAFTCLDGGLAGYAWFLHL